MGEWGGGGRSSKAEVNALLKKTMRKLNTLCSVSIFGHFLPDKKAKNALPDFLLGWDLAHGLIVAEGKPTGEGLLRSLVSCVQLSLGRMTNNEYIQNK